MNSIRDQYNNLLVSSLLLVFAIDVPRVWLTQKNKQ